MNKTEFDNLPQNARDFITLIIKKMRYRKKVRAEVMAELITHFEDELEGTAGEAKEQKAQEIIEQFGDVKLLAALMRRAKKRCRSLRRKVFLRLAQATGIFIIYLLLMFAYLSFGSPRISFDYIDWINKYVSQGRDESLNARNDYTEAAENLYWTKDIYRERLHHSWPGDMNETQLALIKDCLDKNKKSFEFIRKGSKLPYYWHEYNRAADSVEFSPAHLLFADEDMNLVKYKKLAQLLATSCSYNAYSYNIPSAVEDIISLHRFGYHIQSTPPLIEQLVGIAIEGLANSRTFRILSRRDLSSDALSQIQRQLRMDDEGFSFESEKAFWYDIIQRGFTDDGSGNGRVLKEGVPYITESDWKDAVTNLITCRYPSRKEFTFDIENYFDTLDQLLKTPPYAKQGDNIIETKFNTISGKYAMLEILGPSHRKMGHIYRRLRTGRRALLATLAILRYNKDFANLPTSLEELVKKGYLKETPIDPFSGNPFVYKTTSEDFILYSVGDNFKDDSGQIARHTEGKRKGQIKTWADEGDWVFWPIGE